VSGFAIWAVRQSCVRFRAIAWLNLNVLQS
jgi:hypothetical protein